MRTTRATTAVGLTVFVGWMFLGLGRAALWRWQVLVALGASVVASFVLLPFARWFLRWIPVPRPSRFVGMVAALSALISFVFALRALHFMPQVIDGCVYLVEARAMTHGSFGIPVHVPAPLMSQWFFFEGPDQKLHGVFPPGYPLFLMPFVALGLPMLSGPVLAAALVVGQYLVGRNLFAEESDRERAELANRLSLLLLLPSFARALETSELLSHALVAVLSLAAFAMAMRYAKAPSLGPALMMFGAIGFAASARLLDGLLLCLFAVGFVYAKRPATWRPLAWGMLGAVPFVALVLLSQKAATGSYFTPTQSEYFARSDFPADCHRLGLGKTIGCTVEHGEVVKAMGEDGFSLNDLFGVMRERASSLGEDLFGSGQLPIVGFLLVLLVPTFGDLACALFVLLFTVGYSFFYYGNTLFYGARHLFPVAPFLALLVARGLTLFPVFLERAFPKRSLLPVWFGAGVLFLAAGNVMVWNDRMRGVEAYVEPRPNIREAIRRHHLERVIIKSSDPPAVVAATDPWRDGFRRYVLFDDGVSFGELRRRERDLNLVIATGKDDVGRYFAPPPVPKGPTIELERAWPSYQRPSGLAARWTLFPSASGGKLLLVEHATPGGVLDIPVDISVGGTFRLRVDGVRCKSCGNYDIRWDDQTLVPYEGYASKDEWVEGGLSVPLSVSAGRHTIRFSYRGRALEASGDDAMFDRVVGIPE